MEPTLRRYLGTLQSAGVRRIPRGRAAGTAAPPAAPVADRQLRERQTLAAAAARAPGLSAPPQPPTAEAGRAGAGSDGGSRTTDPAATLAAIAEAVRACTACPLCETRHHTVPGEGDPRAAIVFVGEGPGADEDRTGRPFVGKAGKLLDDIITKGMRRRREQVYICNVVKCRPPDNRVPTPTEVAACSGFLEAQLQALAPRAICALGATAAHHLLGNELPMGRLRGQVHAWRGIPVVATYHPAYLLRKPEAKRDAWADIQRLMALADAP